MTTTTTADAVVVGAGVVGASTAFHLAALGAKRVIVCERRTPGAGASGRSGAFIQLHFCNDEPEARLTLASVPYFQRWPELVPKGTCGFVPAGYVRLEGPETEDHLRSHVEMLRGIGVRTGVVEPADLREIAPYLRTDDVAVGAYEPESGHADPMATLHGFLSAAAELGCELWPETEAFGVLSSGGRITGIETSRGLIASPLVVLAAGVWSIPLLRALGLTLPLLAVRTQGARVRLPAPRSTPVLNVGDGVTFSYFHSVGEHNEDVMLGLSGGARRPLGEDAYDTTLDADYAATCLEGLVWRWPGAAGARLVGGAGGPITLTPDDRPIIDRHPTLDGLFFFAGDSGSSFKTAPAVGQVLAEWALLGIPRLVDVSSFCLARFETGAPIQLENDYRRLRGERYASSRK